jgi:hypothetical protein
VKNIYFLIFVCLLLVALVLPACAAPAAAPAPTPTTPAEPAAPPSTPSEPSAPPAPPTPPPPSPAAELSFQAATYTNTDIGFSVKYPKDWKESSAIKSPTLVFLAQAPSQVPILTVDVAAGSSFADTAIAVLKGAGSTDIKVDSLTETTLADGTGASQGVVHYKNPMAPMTIDAFYLGAQKDGKWIVVSVATVGLMAKFDEPKFSEIAHTLLFQ